MAVNAFADKFEEQAHGVICILKFGGVGGIVNTAQMREIANYLRGGPLPVVKMPVVVAPVVVKPVVVAPVVVKPVVVSIPAIKVKLP